MPHVDVTVISDAICPWCFIGKRHLALALADLPDEIAVSVAWQPFELNPAMPPGGMSRRDYRTAKFGSWERSLALDAQVEAAARGAGIEIHHERMTRTPNTFAAHRLIWLAGRHGVQQSVVDELFARYFVNGEDIGDARVLADAADAGGLYGVDVPAFLESREGGDRGTWRAGPRPPARHRRRADVHHQWPDRPVGCPAPRGAARSHSRGQLSAAYRHRHRWYVDYLAGPCDSSIHPLSSRRPGP
ncbi:DsbA family oxidoreductase [Halomonas heilongjiangensis]|uniref:DsbA family oxidoreductase n=1 Tax=Halomonas heilongjiangensis TaxID=1387883 RepID=UPI00197AE9B4|nr:DsbA family oxidoreductase [Halomonas heilongjiangensis]